MIEVNIARNSVNFDALNDEIRATFGSATIGISTSGREVIVHLADDATPAQVAQARRIVEQHDATKLSARQQADAERKARLAQLRKDDAALDSEGLGANQADLRKLARKVLRLEAEIEALRKGE